MKNANYFILKKQLCPDTLMRLNAAYKFGTTYQQKVSVVFF